MSWHENLCVRIKSRMYDERGSYSGMMNENKQDRFMMDILLSTLTDDEHRHKHNEHTQPHQNHFKHSIHHHLSLSLSSSVGEVIRSYIIVVGVLQNMAHTSQSTCSGTSVPVLGY